MHDITIRDFNYIKTLRSEVTAHSSTSSCAYPHINRRTYVSGCVCADAYNLILIFASYYYAPWTLPCTVYIIMTRERHVILKAVLHSRLGYLAAASYIIMLYCLVYN